MAQVTIVLVNENDNLPIFPEQVYQFEIPENSVPQALTSTVPMGISAVTVR